MMVEYLHGQRVNRDEEQVNLPNAEELMEQRMGKGQLNIG
jgi:hypothetical protein